MTAVLENVNKFSYLGLRRRPTYDEIIGLIKENDNITGKLPNRDATFFKASNEGSFFDGLDHLEILKEQQNRILQRQVQDLLLRQSVRANGGTFHLERHRQEQSSSSSSSSSSTELQPDRDTLSVGLQADLQRRQQQLRDKQQQTGEAHRQAVSSQGMMPTLQSFLSGMSGTGRSSRPVEQVDLTRDEPDTFRSISPANSRRRSRASGSSQQNPFDDDIPDIARRRRRNQK